MIDLKDPKKRKLFFYSLGFGLFLLVCISLIAIELTKEPEIEKKQVPENNISGSHLDGDSIAIENEKPEVYVIGEKRDSIANDTDFNIHNGVTGGELARDEVQEQNQDIDAYIKGRRKSVNKMLNSSSEKKRNYNSYGNSNDWTNAPAPSKRVDNSDIDNYASSRPRVSISTTNPTPKEETKSPRQQPISNQNEMSDTEKTRLMRRTGMRDVSNTPNIKINIDTDQNVKNGGNVRLKAMQNCIINGHYVPMYSTFYGRVSFAEDRVHISVNSIQVDGKIVQCNLEGYGLDGLQGIGVTVASLSATSQSSKEELERAINLNRTAVGRIVTSIFSSNKKNDMRIKLLNNHSLIFTQR